MRRMKHEFNPLRVAAAVALVVLFTAAPVAIPFFEPFVSTGWGVKTIQGMLVIAVIQSALLVPFFLSSWRARAMQGKLLISHLAWAVRSGLPLHAALVGLGRAVQNRRLIHIGESLATGSSLTEALNEHRAVISQADRQVIAAAERVGRLSAALDRLKASHEDTSMPGFEAGRLDSYGFLFVVGAYALQRMFVYPRFEMIADDFDVAAQSSSAIFVAPWQLGLIATLIGPTPGQTPTWIALLPAVFAIAALSGFTIMVMRLIPPGRILLEFAWQNVPVLGHIARYRSLADGLLVVEQSLRAGDDLPAALKHAGTLSGLTASRFRRCAEALEQGEEPAHACRQAHLPAMVGAMWRSAINAGNLPSTVAFLGEFYRMRAMRLRCLVQATWPPLCTLTLAVLVGALAATTFSFLVLLTDLCIQGAGSF